jgi:hypothetical protein
MGGDINEAVDDGKTTSVAMSANKKMFFFFVFFSCGSMTGSSFAFNCRVHRHYAGQTPSRVDVQSLFIIIRKKESSKQVKKW